ALVTGWSDQIDPAEALGRGVDFLMAKPFETADVSVVVARALARGDRRPEGPAAT
ncbi:MAG: hypothetical protein HYV62_03520, partial [Candidatus Rokubacteria bacterium]|nr:hypothetical protein [Candidatus Rokubacteria bacterium]